MKGVYLAFQYYIEGGDIAVNSNAIDAFLTFTTLITMLLIVSPILYLSRKRPFSGIVDFLGTVIRCICMMQQHLLLLSVKCWKVKGKCKHHRLCLNYINALYNVIVVRTFFTEVYPRLL